MSAPGKLLTIPDNEVEIRAIRAQGAGGQNVNKVSSAIQLRFDIKKSSLPANTKSRLLHCGDRRISNDGIIVIKAQEHRSQNLNRISALSRLQSLIEAVSFVRKKRIATNVPRRVKVKIVDSKTKRGRLKKLRSKSGLYD